MLVMLLNHLQKVSAFIVGLKEKPKGGEMMDNYITHLHAKILVFLNSSTFPLTKDSILLLALTDAEKLPY